MNKLVFHINTTNMNLLQIQQTATDAAQEAGKAIGQSIGMAEKIKDFAFSYSPKIIGAIVFYIIGSWIIRKIVGIIGKIMAHKQYDASLQSFLMSLIKAALMIFLVISIMGILGIDTSSFAAAIAGVGIAIGAATGALDPWSAGSPSVHGPTRCSFAFRRPIQPTPGDFGRPRGRADRTGGRASDRTGSDFRTTLGGTWDRRCPPTAVGSPCMANY